MAWFKTADFPGELTFNRSNSVGKLVFRISTIFGVESEDALSPTMIFGCMRVRPRRFSKLFRSSRISSQRFFVGMITVIVSAKVAFVAFKKQKCNSVNPLAYYQKKILETTTEGKTDYLGTIPGAASRRCSSIGEPGKVCYREVNFLA